MKRFITLLTCAAFTLASVHADETPPLPPVGNSAPSHATEDGMAISPELSDENTDAPPNTDRKQVGQAAEDGSKAAGSGAGKYVLAACAIAVGVAALILVSQHSGHKK
ncbi:MAG TPA: hypothetical protein VFU89_08325 [Rhabdochlamydiaceae bacterium]|nr:hypothetical protein [Rhabdochlamydiaceae bacterium]